MTEEIDIEKTIKTGYRWRKNNFSVWVDLSFEFLYFCVCTIFGLLAVVGVFALTDMKTISYPTLAVTIVFSVFSLNYVVGLFIMRKMVSLKPDKQITIEELKNLLEEELKHYKIETRENILYANKYKFWSSFYPKDLIIITNEDTVYINQTSDLRGTSSPVPFIVDRIKVASIVEKIKNAT